MAASPARLPVPSFGVTTVALDSYTFGIQLGYSECDDTGGRAQRDNEPSATPDHSREIRKGQLGRLRCHSRDPPGR